VRRHKVGFAATAAIIIILFAGVLISTWQAGRATAALNELRQTAPAFATQAHTLAAAERFDEAIEKLDYAIKLRPDVAEYRVAKADLLQCQFKFAEAAALYREALRLKPGLARAEASALLCDELIAEESAENGELSRESLAKLLSVMEQQQRPAAELMPVARELGEENKFLLDHWLEKLKDLPISPDRPLEERLTLEDTDWFRLDLKGTSVSNLEPLRGMPLDFLDLGGCKGIKDLEPLRGAPLRVLWMSGLSSLDSDSIAVISSLTNLMRLNLSGTKVGDLSALQGLPLEWLYLEGAPVFEISPLRGMPLEILNLRGTRVADLSPLAGMPLTWLDASNIPADDYSPLAGAPLEFFMTQHSPIRDLSFLEGSPIRTLALSECHEALGYAVLEGLESLNLLVLPNSFRSLPKEELAAIARLRKSPTLKSIDTAQRRGRSKRGSSWNIETSQPADEFWKQWDRLDAIVSSLKEGGIRFNLFPLESGNYRLDVMDQPLSDVSFLENAPIEELLVQGTQVSDLRPLEKLPLRILDIRRTPVTDLSPLRSPELSASLREFYLWLVPAQDFSPVSACVNLEYFDAADTALENLDVVRGRKLRVALLTNTRITDISALAGMPLERVMLADTAVTDISPLLRCPNLMDLTLPQKARDRDVEALRTLPKLRKLSFYQNGGFSTQTAEEFWMEREAGGLTPETVSTFLEKSIQDPNDTILAMKVAALQAWFGLDSDYVATCKRELKWGETAVAPIDLERVAKIASLRPASDASIREASLHLARRGWENGSNNPENAPWLSMTLGMAEYRNNHSEAADEALRFAEQGPAANWPNGPATIAAFYRSMSLYKQGRPDEARALFNAAKARMIPCPAETEPLPVSVNPDNLIMWLAYKEASALIEGTPEIRADTK